MDSDADLRAAPEPKYLREDFKKELQFWVKKVKVHFLPLSSLRLQLTTRQLSQTRILSCWSWGIYAILSQSLSDLRWELYHTDCINVRMIQDNPLANQVAGFFSIFLISA